MGCSSLLGIGANVQPITTTRTEDFGVVLLEDVPPPILTLWQKDCCSSWENLSRGPQQPILDFVWPWIWN